MNNNNNKQGWNMNKILVSIMLMTTLTTGCIDIPDIPDTTSTSKSSASKASKPKKVNREDQMYKCYENCTDTRDRCLSEGTYRPAVCYDNYDTCADIVCCSQYKDINPLCR